MVNFLRKLFIKDYQNVNNEKVRENHGKLAAGFGVFTNVLLFLMKMIFGLFASSIAIIGDAINNLSDMGSSLITLFGFKMSGKPADKEHPFGHQRIEYIAGLIVSIVIVALACILCYTSVVKIIDYFNGNLEANTMSDTLQIITFVILFVAILMKLVQGIFYRKMSKIISSVALKASSVDSLTDCLATLCVLISSLLSYFFGWDFLDGFMGVVVALFLGFNGIKMIKETCNPLIGESVDREFVDKIVKDIESRNGVLGLHDLMCHMYGPTKLFVSVHVEVDCHASILESHEMIDEIEYDIKKKYGIEIVIHMDPIDVSNPLTNQYKEQIRSILRDLNSELTFHDFRVVHGEKHTNLLFDVVVPFEFKMSDDEIKELLTSKINENSPVELRLVISIDRPFVR